MLTVEKCEKYTKFVWKNEHSEVLSRNLQSKANLIKNIYIYLNVNSEPCKNNIDDVLQQEIAYSICGKTLLYK